MKKQKEEFFEPIFRHMRINRIIRHIKNPEVLVDFGCGKNFIFLDMIKEKIKRGIGIDNDLLKNKKKKNLTLIKGNLNKKIKVNSNTIDYVISMAVIEHLENPNNLVKEGYRILKPNGKFILTAPTPLAKRILEFLSFKLNLVSRKEIRDHKNYFDKDQLKKMFYDAGFSKVKTEYFQFGMNNFLIAEK